MINDVRNTVLFMLNKENRGYISPSEFDSFADLAQMNIFEDDFHAYSKAIVKENSRLYNSDYSNIPRHLRERLDVFTSTTDLVYNESTSDWSTNEDDFYRLLNLTYQGDDVEEVSKMELNRVLKNSLIAPTKEYPIYIKIGDKFKIYPDISDNTVEALYVRRPKRPKWTYTDVAGNPLFNPSASDYQDFELHPSCEMELVVKILSYCGMSIREVDVVQATQNMDLQEKQNQSL